MSLEIRAVIHSLWLKQTANQPILSELEKIYSGGVLILQAIKNWTAAFDVGRRELDNLSRSERRCSLADRRTGILILEKHCPDA
jgi:hypothetical protein